MEIYLDLQQICLATVGSANRFRSDDDDDGSTIIFIITIAVMDTHTHVEFSAFPTISIRQWENRVSTWENMEQ